MSSLMQGKRIGFAMTGSFCTFERVLRILPEFIERGAEVTPILSETAYGTNTRFMKAADVIGRMEEICGRKVLHTITQAEPIGPKKLLDLLIVAPATGNTLGKLAFGITDTSVTMACKAHWRNGRPVILAVSTNDGLSGSAESIRRLSEKKNTFLLPYIQDDPVGKPDSLVAKMEMLPSFAEKILNEMRLKTEK